MIIHRQFPWHGDGQMLLDGQDELDGQRVQDVQHGLKSLTHPKERT